MNNSQIKAQVTHDPLGSFVQVGQIVLCFGLQRFQLALRLLLHHGEALIRFPLIAAQQRRTRDEQRGRGNKSKQAQTDIHLAMPKLGTEKFEGAHKNPT